jgi:hypothetical protein
MLTGYKRTLRYLLPEEIAEKIKSQNNSVEMLSAIGYTRFIPS